MTDTPLLITERLELWTPAIRDHKGMIDLIADEETRRFLGAMPSDAKGQFERLLRDAGCWSLYGYGNFVFRLRGKTEIIGKGGVFRSWRSKPGLDDVPEAGWIVHRDHWRKSIASEAMRAIMEWFDRVHGAQRIGCMIEAGNAPSERLAAVLGFVEYLREEEDERTVVLYERMT